ncbi:MAG: putative lipid II flippase FtsW [Nitriliruptoraceae bacterium]
MRPVSPSARRGAWSAEGTALTIVTILLVVFGLVMSFSASFVDAAASGDAFRVFRRQATWAVVGGVVFVVAAKLPHRWWRPLSLPMLVASIVGLGLVLVPSIGVMQYGAQRWIGLGSVTVQPSEAAKLAVLLWLAHAYERRRPADGTVHDLANLLVPALPVLGVVGLLVMLQPDLGTTILLAGIVGAVLWIEGLPGRMVAWFALGGAVLIALLTVVAPYRMLRITGWLSPETAPLDGGFQLLQSRYALGSGGVFGLGLGESRGKWHFIPNPDSDFIFAIIGEELGLLGALCVLVLFTALLGLGLRVAYRVPDAFGRTVAFAITAWIVGQALVNIGTVTGLLPITGVTLPLVSVGGSSLLVTLAALGILASLARDVPARRPGARQQQTHRGGRS